MQRFGPGWMSARVSVLSAIVRPLMRVGGVPVKRDRAVELVEQVLARFEAGWDQWPINLLTEIYLFGSFARGALEPHDVDVAV